MTLRAGGQTLSKQSLEERKALGAFLSSRRARMQPDPEASTGRRRTPGLRREEVAGLAGVSVSWYTWLEQGRDISVSTAALERLGGALRLDRAELEHLFALSLRQLPSPRSGEVLGEGLVDLVQAVDPIPAYVRNDRLDILAWNPAVADLFVDYATLEPRARNTLHLMFLHPSYRSLIENWEDVARGTISLFRAGRAKTTDKEPFDQIVERISAGSEEFRRWWPDVDVQGFGEGVKRLHHPRRGQVNLTYVALSPEGQPHLSFVSYLVRSEGPVSESQDD